MSIHRGSLESHPPKGGIVFSKREGFRLAAEMAEMSVVDKFWLLLILGRCERHVRS